MLSIFLRVFIEAISCFQINSFSEISCVVGMYAQTWYQITGNYNFTACREFPALFDSNSSHRVLTSFRYDCDQSGHLYWPLGQEFYW
jgi:hypothetical protein